MTPQVGLLLLLALSVVSTTANPAVTGTSMVPTIVHGLVTSTTRTFYPSNTFNPTHPLHLREWDVPPSVSVWPDPVWSQPTPSWTEPAGSWTPSAWLPQSSWAPTTPTSQTPGVPTGSAPSSSSQTDSYESTHQPNPKDALSNGIIAAVIFGGFFGVCLLSALVIVIMRRCVYRQSTSVPNDVEMTTGTRPDSSGTIVTTSSPRSTIGSVTQCSPERPRSVLSAAPLPSAWQPVHWPPEEVPGLMEPANVHWSRGRACFHN